jgi:predicted amidohydrolase
MNSQNAWTPQIVTLALAQFALQSEPEANLSTALQFIAEASAKKADIICLPELFRSPYFCREETSERDYSEAIPGEVVPALQQAAKRYKIAIIGGSIYERTPQDKLFNTSIVINNSGDFLGSYRKIHIPHDPGFYECNYFEPGDQGFKVFDLGVAKVSVLICYDQWFPEAARASVLKGAEILFYPTAIGSTTESPQVEGDWQLAWETVQRGHAIANSVIVATVNRVGDEATSQFWGGSFVSDAFGKLLIKGNQEQQLLLTQVDLGHSRHTRDSWRFMQSRRPDQYGQLTQK